jgi:hypothetical protein
MAKFLETQTISSELLKLIKEAKEKIILISPYLKVNPQIQERLKTKSLTGTMSEIVMIYGKTELKNSELEWMKTIKDLKVIEKNNLHAKCYLNEEKAIICSMNLHDYSQQNNIEMGLMITKEQDKDAYNELIEEINNIKVNGNRKDPSTFKSFDTNQENEAGSTVESADPIDKKRHDELSMEQKMKFEALKDWRLSKSKIIRAKAYTILTDNEIISIVNEKRIDKNSLYKLLSTKKANQFGNEILDVLFQIERYTIGKVTSVIYQSDDSKYDRVKLLILKTGKEFWFDTTQELPIKNKHVAVSLNDRWFNAYFYLD